MIKMGKKYKYEFIVDGDVKTRLFANSREELKSMIDTMEQWEEKMINGNDM